MSNGNAARIIDETCERFELGTRAGEPVPLHGGVNRLWKITTTSGSYAIHELRGTATHADAIARWQRIFTLETTAAAADVPVAQPLPEPSTGAGAIQIEPDSDLVTVHEWVNATPPPEPSTDPFLASLGRSLARVHTLDLPTTRLAHDVLERRPTQTDWHDLATAAIDQNLTWGPCLLEASEDLDTAITLLDSWDRASRAPRVFSHRDLTPPNTLDREGTAVLIDWESAGPILTSSEIGRTALDHLDRDGQIDPARLRVFLDAYETHAPLPPVGEDWLTLWIRGLIVFAEQCAHSCLAGTGPGAQIQFQAAVLESTPDELRRRLNGVSPLLEVFQAASRS